jgi:hypothetical protein
MTDNAAFAQRIRERFPEGLTAMVAIGGTRTTYILEQNRHSDNPGRITDFWAYKDYLFQRYFDFVEMYLRLGGTNLVITALGYQSFYERGEQYARYISESTLALTEDAARRFYEDQNIDPYFVGIDTLLRLPAEHHAHTLARQLADFQRDWPYAAGRRKLIWEIAAIPLYSVRRADEVLGAAAAAQLDAALAAAPTLQAVHDLLYEYYARAAYGTAIPMPHFYLGSNRNGDIKLRAVLPAAFLCGSPSRFFYTPYPTLFISEDSFKAVIEDVAFGKQKLRSNQVDYDAKYTPELAEAEYQQFMALSRDPGAIIGFTRAVGEHDSTA